MRAILTAASIVLALAASIYHLVVPEYSGTGPSKTLVEVNGQWVINLLIIPVAITLMPLIAASRKLRIAATALLFAFVVISSFSIGLFYAPAAFLLFLSNGVKGPKSGEADEA